MVTVGVRCGFSDRRFRGFNMHRGGIGLQRSSISTRISRMLAIASAAVATGILGACNDEARLSVAVQPMAPPLNTAEIRYRIEIGGRRWQFTLPASATANGVRQTSGEFQTPTSGTARVMFSVVLPDGREVASGDASVAARGDWAWGFDLFAATTDPRRMCFGCVASKSFALPVDLRTDGRDSLWLVWGGNTIKHPRIY